MQSEPDRRTLAIGDIHGCDRALDALLRAISLQDSDRIITLGDYVDRGPGSPAVIERLIQLRGECELISIRGNHEIMMLSALQDPTQLRFWLESGGRQTLEAYGGDIEAIPAEHIDFLQSCRTHFEGDNFFCIHANYSPRLPLDQQPDYTMYWEHLDAFFPPPHISGKTAIVGHTPQRHGQVLETEHLICIDTYCYGGGFLTAVDLSTGDLWQSNIDGEIQQVDESRA